MTIRLEALLLLLNGKVSIRGWTIFGTRLDTWRQEVKQRKGFVLDFTDCYLETLNLDSQAQRIESPN
jgi:hypothetical protein